jgi:hypothetical protein
VAHEETHRAVARIQKKGRGKNRKGIMERRIKIFSFLLMIFDGAWLFNIMYTGNKEYMVVKEGLYDGFDVAITCEFDRRSSQWLFSEGRSLSHHSFKLGSYN